jgi:hypothetical protein
MDVYSELKNAQLEVLSSDPSVAPNAKGRIYHKSTTEPVKVDDGANIHTVLTDRNFQTNISTYVEGEVTDASDQIGATYKSIATAFLNVQTDQDSGLNAVYGVLPLFPTPAATSNSLSPFYIDASDYPTVNGNATKLRIRANIFTNDANPGTYPTFTFGLYPVTRPTLSGSPTSLEFTVGTLVAGSNGAVFTASGPDFQGTRVSAEFDVPASGFYILAAVESAALVPVNGYVGMNATLQMRNP